MSSSNNNLFGIMALVATVLFIAVIAMQALELMYY